VGLRLLDRLPDAPNVVLSPASIVLALAMVRPGARGETAAQMDAVLGSLATNEHAAWLNALDAALATRSGRYPDGSGTPRQVTLRLANAAFGQRGLAFQPAYLAVLAEDFGAGLRLVDYQSDPDGARQTINGWVDQATEGRISQLLAPGAVDPLTRLVLVNALYFAAPWLVPFPAAASGPAPFRLANGETVEVPTMHLQGDLRYSAQGGWQALELPYVGGSLALTLVLPPDQGATGLSQATLDGLLAGLGQRSVRLALPRFTVETRANLVEPLAALGISLLFDPQRADLSGISAQEQLYVTTVAHQARIRVDEAGTEAAAATAVVVGTTALPADEVEVRVDRPFWFVLRDLPTGAVLFLGRVGDPRAG
jgi:serpin B